MTPKQISILAILAITVICVLGGSFYVVISSEEQARLPTSIPQPTPTPWPTGTPRPTSTPAPAWTGVDDVDARAACEEFVRQRLVAPATAEFDYSSEEAIDHGKGRYTVMGTVDAQNALGVVLRTWYVCELHYGEDGLWYLDDISVE